MYDADAIDLDVDDDVSFSLQTGPDGMKVDGATGVVTFAPTSASPASAKVVLEASDGHGGVTEQSFTLTVQGGHGEPEFPAARAVRVAEASPEADRPGEE